MDEPKLMTGDQLRAFLIDRLTRVASVASENEARFDHIHRVIVGEAATISAKMLVERDAVFSKANERVAHSDRMFKWMRGKLGWIVINAIDANDSAKDKKMRRGDLVAAIYAVYRACMEATADGPGKPVPDQKMAVNLSNDWMSEWRIKEAREP